MTTPTEICERLDVTDREATVTDDQIKYMVERFLQWRLPENFSPDCGISFQAGYNADYNNPTDHPARYEPRGTNLFDFTQAREMVRFMVDGMDADLIAAQAEEIERLKARARAAEAALEKMQWQPIESVPDDAKTGSIPLLLFCPGQANGEYVVGHLFCETWIACVDWVPLEPTHWMPLPERPSIRSIGKE